MATQRGGHSYSTKRRRIASNVEAHLDIIKQGDNDNSIPSCVTDGRNIIEPECVEDVLHDEHCSATFDNVLEPGAFQITGNAGDHCTEFEWEESDRELESTVDNGLSSSSDDDDCDNLGQNLSEWALQHNITHVALKSLLKILRSSHPELPSDPRTLLQVPVRKEIVTFNSGGQYYHFGLGSAVLKHVESKNILLDDLSTLSVQVSMDGLPVFKSSKYSFWPISGILLESNCKYPFVIGLYGGPTKNLDLTEFLQPFVDEAHQLDVNGIEVGGKTIRIKIHSIMCDAPARAFIKNVKSHGGYDSCDRCRQKGEYFEHKVIYPEIDAPLRTDAAFNRYEEDGHHLGSTPLQKLSVGLVSQVPLDYMHLVCLGVTRRLLLAWLRGPLKCRQQSRTVESMSAELVKLRAHIPVEFARKPRSLSEIDRWKATEFRLFLLYTGPVVLKDVLSQSVYDHFMLLSVAVMCLCSSVFSQKYCLYANSLLKLFVQHGELLYGREFLVYNVHCLLHLAADVKCFGPLDKISCFTFENSLHNLKKLVRKAHLPLQQVVNRLLEKQNGLREVMPNTRMSRNEPSLERVHNFGPVPPGYNLSEQFKVCRTDLFLLSISEPDNYINIGSDIGVVRNILKCGCDIFIVHENFKELSSFNAYPADSSIFNICYVDKLSGILAVSPLIGVKKCVRLPKGRKSVVLPMIH